MNEYLTKRNERYTKVLKDYPELKEVSNLNALYVYAGRNEKKLQQAITAALICNNPFFNLGNNVSFYTLTECNTPSDHNYSSLSVTGRLLSFMFRHLHSEAMYKVVLEYIEQIYFTL